MKKLLPVFLIVLALLTACAPEQQKESLGYRTVLEQEALSMMEEMEGYVILDVRTPAEYADAHIPGTINVPNESIGNGEIPELPHKDQTVFIYCRSSNHSKQAAEKLARLGYTNLIEFGGINNWTGETVSGQA